MGLLAKLSRVPCLCKGALQMSLLYMIVLEADSSIFTKRVDERHLASGVLAQREHLAPHVLLKVVSHQAEGVVDRVVDVVASAKVAAEADLADHIKRLPLHAAQNTLQ
jgi:hypothetical protein